jgi:hypothetical protein
MPHSTNRSCTQNINKETSELYDTIDHTDLEDMYRIFHLITAEYMFFSVAYATFSKIDCTLGHKIGLNKHKKIQIPSCILSDHNEIKLESSSKKKITENIETHEY